MSEEKFDNVHESAARYESGRGPERDPKTGRFVSTEVRESRKMTVEQAVAHTTKRYARALKKLAE